MTRFLLPSIFLSCLMAIVPIARGEELFIESTAEGQNKMNIAVLPFAQKSAAGHKLPDDPSGVVKNDLKLSGRFTVFETDSADTAFFRTHNISVYIDGSIGFSGDKITLECLLHDAVSRSLIIGKPYSSTGATLRRAAHLFSDEVVYRLFGEKGIASTRIVCTQKQGQAKEVVILDYDGHGLTRVTNNNRLNLTPAWSPDNKAVLYTSYRQETPAIYVTWIYTGKTDRLTANNRLNFSPSWNSVEDKIVFASSVKGDCQIFLMDRDGSDLKQLTFRKGIESSPCFSPNGYEIVFTSDRMGSPQIFIMDTEGANQRRLTFEGKYNDAPAWSPKGDRIAYMCLEEGGFNIYTVAVDGSDVKKLTDKSSNNEHPGYSPDGRLLVFASTRGGGSDLFLMNEDGTGQTRITFQATFIRPSGRDIDLERVALSLGSELFLRQGKDMKKSTSSFVSALFIFSGCGGYVAMVKKEDWDRQEQEINALHDQLKQLQMQQEAANKENLQELKLMRADFGMLFTDMGRNVSQLSGKIEENQNDLQKLNKTTEKLSERKYILKNGGKESTSGGDSIIVQDKLDVQKLFQIARRDFNAKDYERARKEFEEIAAKFPADPAAGECHYWIAEVLYVQKNYKEAVTKYAAFAAGYPQNTLLPATLFKTGLCYQKLNDSVNMKKTWNELIQKFPYSDEAMQAKARLNP